MTHGSLVTSQMVNDQLAQSSGSLTVHQGVNAGPTMPLSDRYVDLQVSSVGDPDTPHNEDHFLYSGQPIWSFGLDHPICNKSKDHRREDHGRNREIGWAPTDILIFNWYANWYSLSLVDGAKQAGAPGEDFYTKMSQPPWIHQRPG